MKNETLPNKPSIIRIKEGDGGMKIIRKECPVCNSKNVRIIDVEKGISKCLNCEMLYLRELPTSNPHTKFREYNGKVGKYIVGKRIIEEFQEFRNQNRVLDFGCGSGKRLLKFKEDDWGVFGVEINENAIKLALKENGLVLNRSITDFPDNFFDIVIMSDVLEHLYDLKFYIKEVKRVLRDGGLFIGVTVNGNSWLCKIFGTNWDRVFTFRDNSFHCNYFSLESLNLLFKGFNEINIDNRYDELSLTTLCDYFSHSENYGAKREPIKCFEVIHKVVTIPDYPLRLLNRKFNGAGFFIIEAVK